MIRLRLLLFAFAVLFYHPLFAQPLSGTYTVNNTTATGGTNFNSLTDAISALNTNGVVAAGAIFNVSSNQTFLETPPALTASGTAGGYIVFRKNGTGNNPVVKPATPGTVSTSAHGGHGDGVIRIAGGDYIEFNGIDIDTNTAYTTNATKYEYGYYILRGSATDGSKFVTIRNANIKLYPGLLYSAAVYVAVYNATGTSMVPTSTAGRHESITIRKNNISRTYNGILLRGYNHSASPNDMYDHFNLVDSNQIEEIGGAATECFGINTIYQDSVQIVANTIKSQVNGATCNGIRPETGINSSISIRYNTVSIRNSSGTLAPINNACGASGTNNFIEIAYNNVENCVTSGSIFYGIYQSVPGALVHIANNNIRNDTCTVGSTSMYIMWSIPGAGGVNHIFGNQIYNIINTGTTGSGTMFPMIFNTGGDTRVYKNNIHDITTNSASGAISIRSNTPNFYMYNNFIHSLYTPNSTGANAILAIDLNGGAANQNVFYNTVYLNATSTSTTSFGAHALYTSTSVNADVRNNILINQSVPGPTSGIVSAYRRSNTTLTTYSDSSNNNCLYVGAAPVARQGLLSDGTNLPQTIAAYKALVGPVRDSASFSELPPFVNITTAPYDLHLSSAGTSACIDGAKRVALLTLSVTTDYDDDPRVIPDVGADENAVTIPPACVTAPIAPANAGTVCVGSLTLSWPAVPNATSYDVYLNTGATATTLVSTSQTGTTYTATVAAGPYAWRVVPKNTIGSATGCATFTFTVNPAVTPTISITASPSGIICAGTPVTFTATTTNAGTAPTYQWKKRIANVGISTTTYTDNALVDGDTITVVLTSNAACASPASVTSNRIIQQVRPRPTASITPAGTANICNGQTILLTANAGTGFTYQWQLGGVNIAAATAATYTAATAGNYRVLVSNGICTDTSAVTAVSIVPTPVATVSPAGTVAFCQGGQALLTGPATAPGLTYQWRLNGANIPGATNNTYAATAAGSYRLVLSNGSCTDTSAVVTVTVNPIPTATATAAGPVNFCQGGSVILNANTGTGITYQWLRNNTVIAGATTTSYTATTTGTYSVVVTNTATGCKDTSRPAIAVTMSVQPATTLTASGNLTFCEGGNVRLQAATGAGYTYTWYNGSNIIAGATTSLYTATTSGVYTVVITNGPCVATSVSRTVVVNPLPAAAITAAGPTALCNGGVVVLNANTGAGLTYQWRLGVANIPGATSASYTAAATGNYSVVVSNGTCSNTSGDIAVTVSSLPLPVISSVGLPSFCQGGSVTLNTATGVGYTYQWQLNTVDIPGATAATYSATATGNYTAVVTNGACVATSAPFTVSVTPAPTALITPAGATAFCQGGSVVLNASRGTGYTYQWTNTGVNIPGATNYQYTATTSGDYSVVIFDGTCPGTAPDVTVRVNSFPVAVVTVIGGVDLSTGVFTSYQWYRNGVLIPGATAQNYTAVRDGFYAVVVTDDLGCSSTSAVQHITSLDVEHVGGAQTKVSLWPNPVEDVLHVEAAIAVNISISAVDGKELLKADKASRVDISHLPQGLYLVRIADHKTGALIRVDKINKK
jgi:hypothetical protein